MSMDVYKRPAPKAVIYPAPNVMPVAFDFLAYRIGIVFISSTFYGLFFVLFALSTLILHQQCKKGSTGSHPSSTNVYLTLSYMMFTVLTTVWILSVVMCTNPHLVSDSDIWNYNPLMLAQHIVGYLANFIGDFVMVYRLYVIWDQKKIILYITTIVGLVQIGLTISVVVYYAKYRLVFSIPNIILVGITISINVISTSLIARTVWKRHELTRAVGGQKIVVRLLAIIIESSALYTAWMLAFLISHFVSVDASQVILYGSPHIAGIASMLINVRVGLGWAMGEEGRSTRSLHNSAFANSRLSGYSTSIDF